MKQWYESDAQLFIKIPHDRPGHDIYPAIDHAGAGAIHFVDAL